MTVLGLPIGTATALAVVVALPVLAYGLFRIDVTRGEGYVTVLGHRSES